MQLEERRSQDWQRDSSLTLRADRLYWFVYTSEGRMEDRRRAFKDDEDAAGAALSLTSWTKDLGNLL